MLRKEIKMPTLRAPRFRSPQVRSPRVRIARLSGPARRAAGVVTGLEIGATQAIAAQAHVRDGRVIADRVAARALPSGLMRDGLVTDAAALSTELRELFGEHQLSKRVRVGLATPRTILRVIDLPPLEERDVRAALLIQAQERIPMPLERAVMDHQTVGLVDTPEGQRLRVIVVVTEREGVECLLEALGGAGLKADGIDLSIFAAIRALSGTTPESGSVLYAQLGDMVNIAIAENGLCRFTRQAPQGLAMVLGRLAERLAIPLDRALALLGSDADSGGSGTHGEVKDIGDASDVRAILARTASELGSELRAAAEFYESQGGNATVAAGVVTGPLATLPEFVPALAAASGLHLSCGKVGAASDTALGTVDARVAPVASGLSIAEVMA